jgi:enterochelin esterase-like enzyme
MFEIKKRLLAVLALTATTLLTFCAPIKPIVVTRIVYLTVETSPQVVQITATHTAVPPGEPPTRPDPLETVIPNVDPTCTQDGTVETYSTDLSTSESSIRFQIYLPPCYEQQSPSRYPIIFLLHGAGGRSLTWNQNGAAEVANRMIRSGQVPPFILVTPGFSALDDKCVTLANDFAPQIDDRFHTLSHPQHRGVGGASSGGHLAACMAFQFPDQFGSAGVFGGGIFAEHTKSFNDWIDATPPQQRPRVLIDIGEQDDMMPFTNVLTRTLIRQDIPYTLITEPGEHSFQYWASHLETYYLWFAKDW